MHRARHTRDADGTPLCEEHWQTVLRQWLAVAKSTNVDADAIESGEHLPDDDGEG